MAGVVGFGAILLFTQFVTVGLLVLTTGGGAIAGYLARARQEYLGRKDKKAQRSLGNARSSGIRPAKLAAPPVEGLYKNGS